MKKITIVFTALILTATVAVISLHSCKKEQLEKTSYPVNSISHEDLQINNLILNFREKVDYIRDHPDYKSGEWVDADSALWYLEATINYSHAFPNEYYKQMKVDTAYLSIPTTDGGMVDLDELAQKYDEMKSMVSNSYHGSGFEEKGLVLVDLSEVSFKSDELTLKVETVTGESNNDPPLPGSITDGPFEEGDNWWYGEEAGKCDPHTWVSDAAEQLYEAINNIIPEPTGGYFFTNQIPVTIKGGNEEIRRQNDPNPQDNYLDYYLYSASEEYGTINNNTLCLEYDEMNLYYNYLKYLMFEKIPGMYVPSAYQIEKIVIYTDDWEMENTSSNHFFHTGTFQYGLKAYYIEGEGPIEIE
nr:hypothetical protein [Bacteroidota bacterium]